MSDLILAPTRLAPTCVVPPAQINGFVPRAAGPQPICGRSNMLTGGRIALAFPNTYMYRIGHPVFTACSNVKVRAANCYTAGSGENPNTDPIQVKWTLEFPYAALFRVYFQGKRQVVLDGGAVLDSDPVGMAVQTGVTGTIVASPSPTSTSFNTTLPYAGPNSSNDWLGQWIQFTSGTLAGQIGVISTTASTSGGTGTQLTCSNVFRSPPNVAINTSFTAAPTAGDAFVVIPVIYERVVISVPPDTAKAITNLTESGTTATATVNAHGYLTGQTITIAGCSPSGYNSTGNGVVITRVDDNTFTYTAPGGGSLTTPAGTFGTAQRLAIQFPVGDLLWSGGSSSPPYEGADTTVDQIDVTFLAGTFGGTTNGYYGANGLVGDPTNGTAPSVWLAGDSIIDGTGSARINNGAGGGDSFGARSYAQIALQRDGIPYLKGSKGGETTYSYSDYPNAVTAQVRQALARGAKYALLAYGPNDLASYPVASTKTNILRMTARHNALGQKVIFVAMPPLTSSTNGWSTIGGQTRRTTTDAVDPSYTSPEARRQYLNSWLRDTSTAGYVYQAGGSAKAAILDCWVASGYEVNSSGIAAANGGYVKTGTQYVAGTASTATGSTSLTDSTKSWTTNAYAGKHVTSLSSGTLTAAEVLSNTATVLTSSSWSNGTPTSGQAYSVHDSYIYDTTHPTELGHQLAATAFPAATMFV